MTETRRLLSSSPERTLEIAQELGASLNPAEIVLLNGNLGAGKTLFVRGLCAGLGMEEIWEVDSPTYTIMNMYPTEPPVYHFDLYRIADESELEALNFYDLMGSNAIKVIEWPERLVHYQLPQPGWAVHLTAEQDGNALPTGQRCITIRPFEREI